MTSVLPTGSSDSTPAVVGGEHRAPETGAPPGRTHRLAARLALGTIPLGGLLTLVSAYFDPKGPEGVDPNVGMYIAYGADRAGADIAATILHYGFLLFGVGLLVAALSMASKRGRAVALTGGVVSAIGFANFSGLVLSDWPSAYLAQTFGPQRAMEMMDASANMPALTAGWMIPAFLGAAIGPIVAAIGLAYGRVISWWLLAFPIAMVAASFVPLPEVLGFVVMVVLAAAFGAAIGVGLLRRAEPSPA